MIELLNGDTPIEDIDFDTINKRIQVQKNFYYDKVFDAETGLYMPRQIKNAEFVLIPKLLPEGSELRRVHDWMMKHDIGQLNTEETSKAAKKTVFTIWDEATGDFHEDFEDKFDNSYIENFNYDNSGKIGNINNYYYKEENIKCINSILDQLILKTKFSEFNYKEMSTKIIEKGLDSKNKKDILINSFNNSSIALIMGEAGTRKTELLCNYYVNIFKGMKILFISNTHTCKNNMIRRVKEKSEWYEEKYEAKTASSISKNKYFFGEYDLVIIDECKSISNRDINELLIKINT